MTRPEIFRPVEPGGDWHLNAVVERHDEAVLAMGFAETADLIVANWVDRGPNDLLFVPLVYNYRHALELVLKFAIRETARLLRGDGHQEADIERAKLDAWLANKAGHNLHRLASKLDVLLKRLGLESLPTETHHVLVALHELDPTGEAFRYATVKSGDSFVDAPRPLLSSPDDFQAHVNIARMHDHFREAFTLLSYGVLSVLGEYADYQADMAADAGC